MPVPLHYPGRVLRVEYRRKVKHGYVRLPVVVVGEVEGGQLVIGRYVRGLLGVV